RRSTTCSPAARPTRSSARCASPPSSNRCRASARYARSGSWKSSASRRTAGSVDSAPTSAPPCSGSSPTPVTADRLTVLSGPAGVGKSTIVSYLREHHPGIWHSVSVTTRPRRDAEVDGVDRHFVDGPTFARMVAADELLEHAQYAGHWYGTPRGPVEQRLATGVPVLLEI